jgi:general secretion pathway protein G
MIRILTKPDNRGVTLVELLSVMVVISILAAVAMPMYKVSVKRAKEYELKRDLRQMRDAIDEYKRWVDNGWINKVTDSGYPPTLDVLVEGVSISNRAVGAGQTLWNPPGQLPPKMKFLRKIPVDPMTGKAEWGQKGNEDAATGAMISSNKDVFDVYSKSDGEALDGTYYRDW